MDIFISREWSSIKFEKISFWFVFLLLCLAYWCILFFSDQLIFTESFYRDYYGQFSVGSIESVLDFQSRFWWIGYAFQPVVVLSKALFLVFCVSVGAFIIDVKFQAQSLLKIGIISDAVFVMSSLWVAINIYLNIETINFQSLLNINSLSLLSYLGTENVVPWLHYPLQTLNLFEVAYVLCISWLLSKQWKPNFVESLNIVIPSYGIGLLIWMVLVVFLTLQVS
jgi:hypothetical protein